MKIALHRLSSAFSSRQTEGVEESVSMSGSGRSAASLRKKSSFVVVKVVKLLLV